MAVAGVDTRPALWRGAEADKASYHGIAIVGRSD
jgi:hypothetical protein